MSAQNCNSQLGFDALLTDAEGANRARRLERETGHLPATMDEAVRFMRILIRQHHAAMLAADVDQVVALRKEAHNLAIRLNGGDRGILAGEDAPGCMLDRLTGADTGTVPLWGQSGVFVILVSNMRVRIEIDGFFGICSGMSFWPGFSAHAVDHGSSFLSSTGYRSFLGIHAAPQAGILPDEFAVKVLSAFIRDELDGRPVAIDVRYRRVGD